MRKQIAIAAIALSMAATGTSVAGAPAKADGAVEFVVERVRNEGAASFRLDLSVEPGDETAFLGAVAARLDRQGKPVAVRPGMVTSLNEHREPTVYAGGHVVSTCAAGQCRTGVTPVASSTVLADDPGPTDTPVVVIAIRAKTTRWTFTANGYRLRRVRPAFRYVTGSATTAVGADYLGLGVEAYGGDASLAGGPKGSLAVGTAPCSTTGSGLVPRGVGRVTLTGGPAPIVVTCPAEDGRLAGGAPARTTWRLDGTVAGDQELRGARLFVVDLPLR